MSDVTIDSELLEALITTAQRVVNHRPDSASAWIPDLKEALDAVKSKVSEFVVDKKVIDTPTVTFIVNGYQFSRPTLYSLIEWLDNGGNWAYVRDLHSYSTPSEIGTALRRLRLLNVVEKDTSRDAQNMRYIQGPRFVEFCKACGFEIEETHS